MKAVRLHETGGPRSLRVEDVNTPEAGAGEVLVRVRAAALNHRDAFIANGRYPNVRLPVTLGSDGAGIVVAAGEGAAVELGDEVVIDPTLDWGDDPAVWQPDRTTILGMPRDGTFASYVAVPAANVHAKPRSLDMQQAAAIPLAGLTAYRAAFTKGGLRRGETVLITGVGGGVQTFVLLFAKHVGARALVTSSSDAKLERARALGADAAFNYRAQTDWHKAAKAAGPIDLVVDSSGGDTLAKAIEAVRPGGRVVVYGGTNGDPTIKAFPLFWKHVTICGTSMGSPQDFRAMLDLVEDGVTPVVDRVYPIDEAVAAVERLEAGEQFGKIVLSIG